MKIVFTHGYFIEEDEKEQEIMRPYPPLGILYLSAWLEQHGWDNAVFDSTFSSKQELYLYLEQQQPDLVPIYTNLMTKVNVIELVKFIKSNPKLQNCIVVLGGPDITYNLQNYIQTGADILIIGEGEQTLLEVTQTIAKGNRLAFGHIDGLAYKDTEGDLVKTKARQRLRPVDSLPFPNRKKIDLHRYLSTWKKHHGQSAISLSTQRGCPYTCRWCSTAVYGQSYRRRSPKNVVEELIYIKKHYNPDTLWFVDDVFTVSHKWLKEFAKEVNRQGAVIPFECISRADRMSEEVILLLQKAGAFRIWIGAESGSQKIIDAMNRRVDVLQVQDMIILAKKHGIETGTFIMLGYPSETIEDINLTIAHLKRSNPDYFTITVAYPIKGTGLFEEVQNIQTKSLDWDTTTDRDRDFERTYPRAFYDYAVRRVVNEVNYHKECVQGKKYSSKAIRFKLKSLLAKWAMNYHKK